VHKIGHNRYNLTGLPHKQILLPSVVVHDVPLPILEDLCGATGVISQGVVPLEAYHHRITGLQNTRHAFVPDGQKLALECTLTSCRHDLQMPVAPAVGDTSVPPCARKDCKIPLPPLYKQTRKNPFLCTNLTVR